MAGPSSIQTLDRLPRYFPKHIVKPFLAEIGAVLAGDALNLDALLGGCTATLGLAPGSDRTAGIGGLLTGHEILAFGRKNWAGTGWGLGRDTN